MDYVIGIDLGTSSVKAIVLNEAGEICASASSEYSPDYPQSGFSEQDPAVWWTHTKKVLTELASGLAGKNVKAVSCSGQMHSSVFLDKDGKVIRPALLWNDTRTTAQTKEIVEKIGSEKELLENVYNRALEGFTLPKILWLRENEPENFAKVDRVIMPKDYINYMLTGVIKTDVSDAAGTLLFGVVAKCWSKTLCDKVGLPMSILPEVLESTGVVGEVLPRIASELGFPAGVKIIAGGADNSCAGIGNGVVSPGQAVVSVGTSGTVVAFLQEFSKDAEVTGDVHLFSYSYPDSMYAMGCMLSAGECRSWLRRSVLGGMSYAEMDEAAGKAEAGSGGVVFLPYLFGERCPYPDADARGAFFGLSTGTGAGELARAVMEGVAFGLCDMFELVESFSEINEIYLTGGGAKSEVFAQIIADIFGRELSVLNVSEGPAFGAALIAAVACGVFATFTEAKTKATKVIKTISPDSAKHDIYKKYHEVYKNLYKANKMIFKELAKLR